MHGLHRTASPDKPMSDSEIIQFALHRLIPSSFNTEVEFSVPSFLAAIERASLLSHEGRNNIVRLSAFSINPICSFSAPVNAPLF